MQILVIPCTRGTSVAILTGQVRRMVKTLPVGSYGPACPCGEGIRHDGKRAANLVALNTLRSAVYVIFD